ncbi:MAG: hypothetical protein OEU63_03140, partial [Gammaproteobacteria bacterium]|nr:hypothetical protein [Gammaproteobacteria bacterium]
MKPIISPPLLLKRFSHGRLAGCVIAGLFLFSGPASAQSGDTIVKDYDISLSQQQCRQTSIRVLHSLAGPDKPVMQLEPVVFYSASSPS